MTHSTSPRDLHWRKSSRSQEQGACVELAAFSKRVAIRDSKNPEGPVLEVDRQALRTLSLHVGKGV